MENPKLSDIDATGIMADGTMVNGRPPDGVPLVSSGPVLERPGSPLTAAVQSEAKRVRLPKEIRLAGDYTAMDVEGEPGLQEGHKGVVELLSDSGQNPEITRVSYANMVGRTLRKEDQFQDGVALDPNKVIVLDEDCTVNRTGKFPTIKFSERVHDQIDSAMKNVIIVRLLGRNIGFQTLLNRIHILWKPNGDLQLIDLDNNYFLVRVEDPRDYRKILTEGPWTIFGSYLTVQPWSRSFSTTEKYPTHVVVWVRLPGLPYRYYSKALFRRIAAVVGEVVRVDYNTREGERGKFVRLAIIVDLNKPLVPFIGIDDFVQNLEYEGLHNVYFKCGVYGHSQGSCSIDNRPVSNESHSQQGPTKGGLEAVSATSKDGLFGPWMMVDTRRRKPQAMKLNSKASEQSFRTNNGSRFAILGADSGSPDTDQIVEVMEEGRRLPLHVRAGALEETRDLGKTGAASTGNVVHGASGATNAGGISKVSKKVIDKAVVLPMVEGQQVSFVEHSSHNKVHAAVSIFEQNHGRKAADRVVQGKNMGGKVKGNKENVRQGLKVRKPSDTRTISRPVLSDWVDNMTSKLDNFAKDKELEPGGVGRLFVNQEGELEIDSAMVSRGQAHASSSTTVQDSLQSQMNTGC
ncbi:hypothetical protein GQ457_09G004750 [Hibiscus cannabinus]